MNKNLFFFELQKIFIRKNIFLFLIPFVVILIFLFVVSNQDENSKQMLSTTLNSELDSLTQAHNNLPEIPETQDIKENIMIQISIKEKQAQAFETGNWKEYLKFQNEQQELVLLGVENGNIVTSSTNEEIEQQISLNNEFLTRNVQPMEFSGNTKGFYFLKYVLDIFYGIIGILILGIFIGNIYTKEKEQSTIKFLLAQSFSKINIFSMKFLLSIIFGVAMISTFIVFIFLSGTFVFGIGDIQYPVLLQQELSYKIVNLIEYLSMSTLLFLFLILFTISFIFLLSVTIDNSMLVLIVVIITYYIFGYVIPSKEVMNSLIHLIPFTYINVADVIEGSLAVQTKNFGISVKNGISASILSSLFLTVISVLILKTKKLS
ncbi:hypothetical protein ACRC6Q_18915 [Planococcus sp. SE5232]|uniref:hypothetical protein n=1 Tax=unclassified Planococcus (in: firmicutes) TaxID=2662419 RepID=UPI003D6B8BAE